MLLRELWNSIGKYKTYVENGAVKAEFERFLTWLIIKFKFGKSIFSVDNWGIYIFFISHNSLSEAYVSPCRHTLDIIQKNYIYILSAALYSYSFAKYIDIIIAGIGKYSAKKYCYVLTKNNNFTKLSSHEENCLSLVFARHLWFLHVHPWLLWSMHICCYNMA